MLHPIPPLFSHDCGGATQTRVQAPVLRWCSHLGLSSSPFQHRTAASAQLTFGSPDLTVHASSWGGFLFIQIPGHCPAAHLRLAWDPPRSCSPCPVLPCAVDAPGPRGLRVGLCVPLRVGSARDPSWSSRAWPSH